jgi:hypothetical protein
MPKTESKHEYPEGYADSLKKSSAKKTVVEKQIPTENEEWDLVKPANLLPFVKWEITPEIEGVITNHREIDGEYGKQEICDVGEYSVGITTALRALLKLDGDYVKIKFEGLEESSKGRQFKNFTIRRKKDKPLS